MSTKKFFLCMILAVVMTVSCLSFAGAEEVEYVYLGGRPIGIVIEDEGLAICGKTEVITNKGADLPSVRLEIYPGDYLIDVNGVRVKSIKDLAGALSDVKDGESVIIGVKRGNQRIEFEIKPATEALSGKKKLGLVIREGTSGIGTVTYIKKDGSFGALGHSIGENLQSERGKVYKCRITGVNLPRTNEAGELRGVFDKRDMSVGSVYLNNDFGIFGKMNGSVRQMSEVRLGNRKIVKEGKAYIYTCIDGDQPQRYEIEIVKAYSQSKPSVKSMVIKVTDEKLLAKSGGIVQGMSGSPIVQDGYLIGAVTHVFTGDATKGYGVYVDWMINN